MKTTHNPYKFYTQKLNDGRIKTIAISTYAGRTVRGSAICDFSDQYNEEVGRKIASARCATKIAQKRVNRANNKRLEAEEMMKAALAHYLKMIVYYNDAVEAQERAMYLSKEVRS